MSSNSFRDSVMGRSLHGLGLLSSLHAASCLRNSLVGPRLRMGNAGRRALMWMTSTHHVGA